MSGQCTVPTSLDNELAALPKYSIRDLRARCFAAIPHPHSVLICCAEASHKNYKSKPTADYRSVLVAKADMCGAQAWSALGQKRITRVVCRDDLFR